MPSVPVCALHVVSHWPLHLTLTLTLPSILGYSTSFDQHELEYQNTSSVANYTPLVSSPYYCILLPWHQYILILILQL